MLKKYFVLCGIEKAFPNFHVLHLKKIQAEYQINCKLSKKKYIYKWNKLLDTDPLEMWAIFHWIEKKKYFFYPYLVHLDQFQKAHRLVHVLSGWEMTKILFWTRSLGKLLGGDQAIIMILFGAICQNIESSVWSLFSSWVTAVALKMTFIFTPQFFLSQFKGEFWSENAMNCLMMRKIWSQEKGEIKKTNKVLKEFCQLRGKGQMWENYNWDNWIAPVFYFSLFKRNMSPRWHTSGHQLSTLFDVLLLCFYSFTSLFCQICVKCQL